MAVTAADIKKRIKTKLLEDDIDPLLSDAVTLLGSFDTPITSELVLTYLACHFVAVLDPRTNQRSTGSSSAVFEMTTAAGRSGLGSTTYGQQAISMDHTGQLRDYKDGPPLKTSMVAF